MPTYKPWNLFCENIVHSTWWVYKHVRAPVQILQAMCSVKWEVKELMSQHNSYVDTLLKVRANATILTLYQPMTHICVMSCHKPIRIYMGGLILGVNTLYRLFCFLSCFLWSVKNLLLYTIRFYKLKPKWGVVYQADPLRVHVQLQVGTRPPALLREG